MLNDRIRAVQAELRQADEESNLLQRPPAKRVVGVEAGKVAELRAIATHP